MIGSMTARVTGRREPDALTCQRKAEQRMASPSGFPRRRSLAPVEGESLPDVHPPYIVTGRPDPGVRDFEPRSALDGGPDGLDFYRHIAANAPRFLKSGGSLLVEIGMTQEPAVRALFEEHLEVGKTYKDTGGRPRVIAARKR